MGQTPRAVMALPVVASLEVQLYSPELVVILVAFAIACAMALTVSSGDNYIVVTMARDDFKRPFISQGELLRAGFLGTVWCLGVVCTLSFWLGISVFGYPPRHIMREIPGRMHSVVEV